jgi:hypothetical protein
MVFLGHMSGNSASLLAAFAPERLAPTLEYEYADHPPIGTASSSASGNHIQTGTSFLRFHEALA